MNDRIIRFISFTTQADGFESMEFSYLTKMVRFDDHPVMEYHFFLVLNWVHYKIIKMQSLQFDV